MPPVYLLNFLNYDSQYGPFCNAIFVSLHSKRHTYNKGLHISWNKHWKKKHLEKDCSETFH